ncbi:MAG: DUF6115 domain-containing protein [Tuberibacillus sp.]
MIAILLVLSLLLHLVTFYIIIILVQRINQIKDQHNDDVLSNMDALLESHLEAVRLENQALIEKMEASMAKKNPGAGKKPKPQVHKTTSDASVTAMNEKKEPDIAALPVENIVDHIEQSETAQVLHWHEKGMSSQEIAKKLDMGHGEVELIINLNKKRTK